MIERLIEEDGEKLDRSPTARRAQRQQWLSRKSLSGKNNQERYNFYRQQ